MKTVLSQRLAVFIGRADQQTLASWGRVTRRSLDPAESLSTLSHGRFTKPSCDDRPSRQNVVYHHDNDHPRKDGWSSQIARNRRQAQSHFPDSMMSVAYWDVSTDSPALTRYLHSHWGGAGRYDSLSTTRAGGCLPRGYLCQETREWSRLWSFTTPAGVGLTSRGVVSGFMTFCQICWRRVTTLCTKSAAYIKVYVMSVPSFIIFRKSSSFLSFLASSFVTSPVLGPLL